MDSGSKAGGYGPSRTMYPITMWIFALLGAFVVTVGIRNIRRLLANQSIG